jgi:hypothetical protein
VTPAEELLAAADELDARVAAATRGPWRHDTPWWHTDAQGDAEPTGLLVTAVRRNPVLLGVPTWARNAPNSSRAEANLRYVEAVNPDVGRALVVLLRHFAAVVDHASDAEVQAVYHRELDLARAILAAKEAR